MWRQGIGSSDVQWHLKISGSIVGTAERWSPKSPSATIFVPQKWSDVVSSLWDWGPGSQSELNRSWSTWASEKRYTGHHIMAFFKQHSAGASSRPSSKPPHWKKAACLHRIGYPVVWSTVAVGVGMVKKKIANFSQMRTWESICHYIPTTEITSASTTYCSGSQRSPSPNWLCTDAVFVGKRDPILPVRTPLMWYQCIIHK